MRSVLALFGTLLFLFAPAPVAAAALSSTIERPVPFAANVDVLTPGLAARWGLAPPEWPVSGAWTEARLYQGDSDHVLVVSREDGALERFVLDESAVAALQAAADGGFAAAGSQPAPTIADASAESAGGRFVRNQLLLGALVYGPSATLLAGDEDEEEAALALYLATAGVTILGATKISKSQTVTRSQAHLSTDGGWKGAAAGLGLAYAAGLTGDDEAGYGAAMLAGGLGGAALGFKLGRPLTEGEAHSASFGSTFSAALTAGIIGISGGFQGETVRGEVAGIVAGGVLGYPLGLHYARNASYAITTGDVGALTVATSVGVLGAAAFVVDREDDRSDREAASILTAGLLAGAFAGDRLLVRPYDHTETEGWLVGIGGVAGGLIGAAILFTADSDGDENGAAIAGAGAGGAALGMWLTERMIRPKAGARRPPR